MIEKIISRLDGAKRTGPGRYIARCPAHDDRSPSLRVTERDGAILLKCFAGCETEAVLAAVGLTFKDIFPERLEERRGSKPKYSAHELFPLLVQEAVVLGLAYREVMNFGGLTTGDFARAEQAYETVLRLHSELAR